LKPSWCFFWSREGGFFSSVFFGKRDSLPDNRPRCLLVAVSPGYFDTLMSCPGSSTSSEMCDEHMLAAGIGAGLVRMSIGFTDTIAQRWQQLSSALEIIL